MYVHAVVHSLWPTGRPFPDRTCVPHTTHVTRVRCDPCMGLNRASEPKNTTFNLMDGHHKHTLATARRNPNHLAPCTPQRCSQKCEIVLVCFGVSTHHMSPLPRTRFTAGVMGATRRRLIGFGSLFDAQHRNPDAKQGRGREIRQHTRGRVCNQTTILRCFLWVFGLQMGVLKPSKTSDLKVILLVPSHKQGSEGQSTDLSPLAGV